VLEPDEGVTLTL